MSFLSYDSAIPSLIQLELYVFPIKWLRLPSLIQLVVEMSFSGCDGVTYSSECDADANEVDIKSQGECKDDVREVPCPAIFAPVCCDGDVTYDNDCVAEANGAENCSQGACPAGTPCPLNYAPVW